MKQADALLELQGAERRVRLEVAVLRTCRAAETENGRVNFTAEPREPGSVTA